MQNDIQTLVNNSIQKKNWVAGKDWVQYAGSYFCEKEYVAAISSILNGWLGLAELGTRFETNFAPQLGKSKGIFVNSGSSANLLMVSSLKSSRLYNLPEGTKIATAAAGFPTTINPIIQNNFTPVFVDIEPETLNIDLDKLEATLKEQPDIKVLIFAHVLGNPPDMDRVMNLVEKYNLILLEDCCDALGSTYKGKLLGSFGDMSTCSFYPAHHICTGEGGFVAYNTDKHDTVLRSLRDWGRGCYCSGKASVCLKDGFCKKRYSNWIPALPEEIVDHKYVYDEIGYNLKPLELQAAIGLEQIKKIPEIINKRKENYNRLKKIFEPYSDLFKIHFATKDSDPAWFAFPVTVLKNNKFKRIDVVKHFEENKIQTRNYFAGNILLQPGYSGISVQGTPLTDYPVSTMVTTDTFFLGTSPVITSEQLEYIEKTLKSFMANWK